MGSLPPTLGSDQKARVAEHREGNPGRSGKLALVSRPKDFRFYPNSGGRPSEGFKPMSDRIQILFWSSHLAVIGGD